MDAKPADAGELAHRIARLVEERGWNQEEFARIARLNRHTVRQILHSGPGRRLRNATVSACARALGLTVNDLRTAPLDRLLPRMADAQTGGASRGVRRLYDHATQPELVAWAERNPERARALTEGEIDELLAMQGDGGPLTAFGVEGFVERIERRRHLQRQVDVIAGTEYLELLEKMVALLYEKVRPQEKG
jgi:transcriptional regulator with XRE-family HTH domain